MTPKAVVNAIELRLGVSGTPRQLRDAIEHELLASGMTPVFAAEEMERLKKRVSEEILRRREERDLLGEIATIHLRGDGNEIVHGSSHVFSDDPDQIKDAKINRVSATEIYAYLRSLNFSRFESFGKCVLRELGCRARVTPHAGDQGIDFYGEFSIGGLLGADPATLRLMHETRVILVGQAKHYPENPLGPNVVRELVGALSLSRTFTYSRDDLDLLNDVELRPFSPVLALLFTTGGFTKGARHLARRAGLIAFSGWQLAVFLADRGVGLIPDGKGRRFDKAEFDAWLEAAEPI